MCPNGDQVQYVSIVFEGSVLEGAPSPDGEEILELGWCGRDVLSTLDINLLSASLLQQVGWMTKA